MQVNRYLKDKAMDWIDHALGRPVDPMAETFRDYFFVCGQGETRRHMAESSHWTADNPAKEDVYFYVTNAGREALAAHLKQIGDKHRLWTVSWRGYDMATVATTAAKARYSKWLDVSDSDDSLTFAKFQRESKVRLA